MRRSTLRGFTVIEVLIAVLLGSVVVILMLGLFSFSTKSFGRTQQRMDARETARRIMNEVRHCVTDAEHYLIRDSGQSLEVTAAHETASIKFVPATGLVVKSVVHENGGHPSTIASGVLDFSIHQLRPGLLRVIAIVDRPVVQDGLASLGALHAVDEILCPAAGRDLEVPFNPAYETP